MRCLTLLLEDFMMVVLSVFVCDVVEVLEVVVVGGSGGDPRTFYFIVGSLLDSVYLPCQ